MRVEVADFPVVRKNHRDDVLVYRGGCYDIIHEGHIEGLSLAKQQGDYLVVGIAPDKQVRARKGSSRPVNDQERRAAVVDAIRYVDYTAVTEMPSIFPNSRGISVIGLLRPDIYVEGPDSFTPWTEDELALMEKWGTKIFIDDRPKTVSTSEIIGRIASTHGTITPAQD